MRLSIDTLERLSQRVGQAVGTDRVEIEVEFEQDVKCELSTLDELTAFENTKGKRITDLDFSAREFERRVSISLTNKGWHNVYVHVEGLPWETSEALVQDAFKIVTEGAPWVAPLWRLPLGAQFLLPMAVWLPVYYNASAVLTPKLGFWLSMAIIIGAQAAISGVWSWFVKEHFPNFLVLVGEGQAEHKKLPGRLKWVVGGILTVLGAPALYDLVKWWIMG